MHSLFSFKKAPEEQQRTLLLRKTARDAKLGSSTYFIAVPGESRYQPHALNILFLTVPKWLGSVCPELTSRESQQLGSMLKQEKENLYIRMRVYLCVCAHTCICMYTFNPTAAKSFPPCCKFIKICARYRGHILYIYLYLI